MNPLPGFRDFYPDDCAKRNHILDHWKRTATRYGFSEYDGPNLESVDVYKKKSGGELLGQLFDFIDKGDRHVALRPEMTPTLARMIVARERDFKKPMKWFCAPTFFRYEKQQRGRLREFLQLNCDIIGDPSDFADAELLALAIDVLRDLGLSSSDFVVRLSDREAWTNFAARHAITGERFSAFLALIDKLERMTPADAESKLQPFGVTLDAVRSFIANPGDAAPRLDAILKNLAARGLGDFVSVDLTIVRGLAYYTGMVFEVFDRAKNERALAGGGRYDTLIETMSDGRIRLPALGFGMGDVVLGNLIQETPAAREKRDDWLSQAASLDAFIIIAAPERTAEALATVQKLRDSGLRVDYGAPGEKVGKQFQAAEHKRSVHAIVIGSEFPSLKVKHLASRTEREATPDTLLSALQCTSI
jgi:histidyl-tRNA synthetase